MKVDIGVGSRVTDAWLSLEKRVDGLVVEGGLGG